MKLTEAIERLIATHHIPREKVIEAVGDFAALTNDRARRLLLDLADGDYGGMSKKPPHDDACPLQIARVYYYARTLFGESFMPPLREFVRSIYTDAPEPRHLTHRQAARIIIELDKKIHPPPSTP